MALTDAERIQMVLVAVMRHNDFSVKNDGGYYSLPEIPLIRPTKVMVIGWYIFEVETITSLIVPVKVIVSGNMTFASFMAT